MMNRVSELEVVPLRDHWENEEENFTPWLAENISYLGDAVEMELEVQSTEAKVTGGHNYSADIHATDIDGDRDVIIENKYDELDHKHLGQSLVYAGGIDADIIIWVAEEFTDPYIDAINWINNRSNDETGFFAVEISLVRIEDSPVAPRVNVVEKPSSWKKLVNVSSEADKAHQRFWREFEQRLEERGLDHYKRSEAPAKAAYKITRIAGEYLRPTATLHDEIFCKLRIYNTDGHFGDVDRDTAMKAIRNEVASLSNTHISEEEIKNIEWEKRPEKKTDNVILRYSEPVDRNDDSNWDRYHDWLIDATMVFDRVFSEHLE